MPLPYLSSYVIMLRQMTGSVFRAGKAAFAGFIAGMKGSERAVIEHGHTEGTAPQ